MHEMSGNEGFKQRGMEKISYDSAWFYDKKLFGIRFFLAHDYIQQQVV